MSLYVLILAAGRGTRTATSTPKVMLPLAGIALLERVYNTARSLSPSGMGIVYSPDIPAIKNTFQQFSVDWIVQDQPLGTGHAVEQAIPFFSNCKKVLILYADVPLVSSDVLRQLVSKTDQSELSLLTTYTDQPEGLGRIIRDDQLNILAVVEDKDATDQQRTIHEVNTGMLCCRTDLLKQFIPQLENTNQQQEYYLTDIIAHAAESDYSIDTVCLSEPQSVQGVNDLLQLAKAERWYQSKQMAQWARKGVRFYDPARVDIRGDQVTLAPDVVVDINVILQGKTDIAAGASIGAHSVLTDVTIGEGVIVHPHSIIEGAVLSANSVVGPFARIRPGTVIAAGVKVGNFVEIKNTYIGSHSKVSHLSYLGDAQIGKNVNIGAGTITCNYDGVNKWESVIDDGAFIGSNTALIAPVKIGQDAMIAAGSVITVSAPEKSLTIARARQCTVQKWKRPLKKARKEK